MSFPPYASYKDSGLEWLGEVPVDWHLKKFRYTFRESDEKIADDIVGPMLSVSGYRGIEVKEYDDENRRRTDEDLIGYRIVRVGQLVVNTMWLNYAGLGVSAWEGHVSPAYRAYWFTDHELDRRFIHYLVRSAVYVQGYTQLLTGVRPNSLQMSRSDLMDFPILIPTAHIQAAIADFLDRETAKIDALVEAQRRLIALLKEKRQAVISHAVTKGLDPSAPLKPSGIPWLGDVPAHWEVVALSRLVQSRRPITYGIVQPGPADPNGRYMIRGQDYSSGWVAPEEIFRVSSAVEEPYRRARVRSGDLVITIVGAGVGNVAVVPDELEGANLTQTTARIAPDSGIVDPSFLQLALTSNLARTQVAIYQKGAAQPGLNLEHLKAFRLLVPPLSEQREIARRASEATASLVLLITEAEGACVLFTERRAALISAAVTGKIDVRGLAAQPESAEAA